MFWEARMWMAFYMEQVPDHFQVRFLLAYEVPETKTCPWVSNQAAKLSSLLGLHSEEKRLQNQPAPTLSSTGHWVWLARVSPQGEGFRFFLRVRITVTGDEVGEACALSSLHVSMKSTCLVEDAQKACGPVRTDGRQGQEGKSGYRCPQTAIGSHTQGLFSSGSSRLLEERRRSWVW